MPGPLRLALLPLDLSFRAAALALGLARRAAGWVIPDATADEVPAEVPPARVTISSSEPASKGRSRGRAAPGRVRRAPEPEPAHVSEEPVPVASFAEAGAEDGAGPEVEVAEPWDGYDRMRASEIERRLTRAGPNVAAAVKLYEGAGRARQTVLRAAERRLEP